MVGLGLAIKEESGPGLTHVAGGTQLNSWAFSREDFFFLSRGAGGSFVWGRHQRVTGHKAA